jgi:hypothetical protein
VGPVGWNVAHCPHTLRLHCLEQWAAVPQRIPYAPHCTGQSLHLQELPWKRATSNTRGMCVGHCDADGALPAVNALVQGGAEVLPGSAITTTSAAAVKHN